MTRVRQFVLLPMLLLSSSALALPPEVARVGFDAATNQLADRISGARIVPRGSFMASAAPHGMALRLDGNSTSVSGRALPRITESDEWAITAWIKLDALPWNDTPILDQRTPSGRLFFGIDALGHVVAERSASQAAAQRWATSVRVAPRAWTFLTLSCHAGRLTIALNGKAVATARVEASNDEGGNSAELLIGRTRNSALPFPNNAIHPLLPQEFTLEGSVGEISVFSRALADKDLSTLMRGVNAAMLVQSGAPPLPRWQGAPGGFGAFHTTLRYDESWDKPRRVPPNSDVVVRFADAPIQLVFWQGANYIPAWVTENGRWYSDEFMEIYGKPRCPDGEDCEPMSDKQVRYSHVEILESTPARAVVHWRYALSEVENAKLADAPDPSQWGAWADEYWTVYPDGTAVRRQTLWTDHPEREASEFQESIIIMPAGQRPEDNLNFDALSLANLKGESRSYTWLPRDATELAKPRGPDHFTGLADPMIQWVNLKSQWKPFQVTSAGPAKFEGINWEPSMSSFEWWNHWPVAQLRSSGRPALTDDRPSHTSISHIYWPIWQKDEKTISRLLLTGLTRNSASGMAPLARSWIEPPSARLAGGGTDLRYDMAERAYRLSSPAKTALTIEVAASSEHPLVNPAFVVEGWHGRAAVRIEGAAAGEPQLGYVDSLEGSRLIAYLPLSATAPVRIVISPVTAAQ